MPQARRCVRRDSVKAGWYSPEGWAVWLPPVWGCSGWRSSEVPSPVILMKDSGSHPLGPYQV